MGFDRADNSSALFRTLHFAGIRTLRRRSHKTRITWARMNDLAQTWLPPARILHPWPEQRLSVLIPGKSRMH
jgi:hypothetical protein